VLVGLVIHPSRPEAAAAAEIAKRICAERDVRHVTVDVWSDERPCRELVTGLLERMDLVLTIGGDGTLLRGLDVAVAAGAPVLGVNAGRLGFLTQFTTADLATVLAAAIGGNVMTVDRMLLTLRASRFPRVPADLDGLLRFGGGSPSAHRPDEAADAGWGVPLPLTALNDVVLEKVGRDRQASLAVYISGRLFASYSADAVVIATSTGATAYSFAAGGPVLSPRLDAMVFTPVAPHMAFNRSIVVAPDEPIGVRVLDRSGPVAVVLDGRVQGVLDPGDWVAVFPAARRACLIVPEHEDFFGRLRERFSLADAPAAVADTDHALPLLLRSRIPLPDDLLRLHLAPPEEPELI
jgi:NAD+ kinase